MRPLSTDLFDSVEKQIIATHPRDFEGENITQLVEKLRPLIRQLEKGRSWNSSKNVNLCRTLCEACADAKNEEYSGEMSKLLSQVKAKSFKITHLNNK